MAPTLTAEQRQQAAQNNVAKEAKGYFRDQWNKWTSSWQSSFDEITNFIDKFGDLLGVDAQGNNPLRNGYNSLMTFLRPILEIFKPLLSVFTGIQNWLGVTNPDATIAGTTMKGLLEQPAVYQPAVATLGLDDATAADVTTKIQTICTDAANQFIKDGIPSLEANGKPEEALRRAKDAHKKIVDLLLGDNDHPGTLMNQYPNLDPLKRKAMAEQVAGYYTDLPPTPEGGHNIAQLSAMTLDKGLAGMFAQLQHKAAAAGDAQNYLTATDVTFSPNTPALDEVNRIRASIAIASSAPPATTDASSNVSHDQLGTLSPGAPPPQVAQITSPAPPRS
jgi:hypothetical protein